MTGVTIKTTLQNIPAHDNPSMADDNTRPGSSAHRDPATAEPRFSWRMHDELLVPSMTALLLFTIGIGLAIHTHASMYKSMASTIILLIISLGALISSRLAKNYWLVYFSVVLVATALYPIFVLIFGSPRFF